MQEETSRKIYIDDGDKEKMVINNILTNSILHDKKVFKENKKITHAAIKWKPRASAPEMVITVEQRDPQADRITENQEFK